MMQQTSLPKLRRLPQVIQKTQLRQGLSESGLPKRAIASVYSLTVLSSTYDDDGHKGEFYYDAI
jgi:hypothetical protein